ncbi:hypothetical protein AB0L47_32570 [Streptomyces bobili]|uniref:hypothetical protein n=1 Tax=Streptomyces bobili TaxID=67280 RepID=UPI003426097D
MQNQSISTLGITLLRTTQLVAAVAAETRKTTELHRDLLSTIEDLEAQTADLNAESALHDDQLTGIDSELRALQEQLEPLTTGTSEVLAARSRLEQEPAVHAQIEQLEEMKASLSNALPAPAAGQAGRHSRCRRFRLRADDSSNA